jgi:hypothetical protein
MAIAMNMFAGVPFTQGLAQYGASQTASKGAEKLGLGEVGQFAAGTLAGMKVGNLFRKPMSLEARGEALKKVSYKQSKDVAKSIGNVEAEGLLEDVLHLHDNIKGLESGPKAEIIKQLGEIDNKITSINKKSFINLADAQELRTHFNDLASSTSDDAKRSYYKAMGNLIRHKVINPAKVAHPEYGKILDVADNLHIGLSGSKRLQQLIGKTDKLAKIVKENPLSATILGGVSTALPYVGKVAPKALVATIGAREGAKKLAAAEFLAKSKEARKILYDMSKDALNNDKTLISNNLVKFNKLSKEYEDKKFKDSGIEWID